MSEIALKLEGIGKKYELGRKTNQSLVELLKNFTFFNNYEKKPIEEFWALKDVSFEIKHGEAVGVIGKNGAGKSTLLKILSRITEPTKGRIEINGRISSLLEVGTGFHPELSGRENIFLNGTILGMKRAEIKQKFDEIVEFSGVEKFLDTPVKHYSSGMYVRLAFAVAAHLEPEILIIDEVLAVGDAEFQNKCLGKMKDVTNQGRTVLFVSHNMAAIKAFCSQCILLKNGSLKNQGNTQLLIDEYFESDTKENTGISGMFEALNLEDLTSSDLIIKKIKLLNHNDVVSEIHDTNKPIKIIIDYKANIDISGSRLNLQVLDEKDNIAFTTSTHNKEPSKKPAGNYQAICHIPAQLLNGGEYKIKLQIGIPGFKILLESKTYLKFKTILTGNNGSIYQEKWPGIVAPKIDWDIFQL